MTTYKQTPAQGSAGFSLVELTTVVVILGVLSMMAVPRYQTAVEHAKAAEAFNFLAQIEAGQERHNARTGEYAQTVGQLNVKVSSPKHFSAGPFTSYDWQTQWELRLTRSGAFSGFGNYTVTWNQGGFERSRSSLAEGLIPVK